MVSIQLSWAEVKEEMTEQKGLDPSVADKIGEYVKYKGVSHQLSSIITSNEIPHRWP